MKNKFYFYLTLGLLLFIVYSSCKKDKNNAVSEFELKQYNYNLKRLTGIIGKFHNEGITEALSNNNDRLIPEIKALFPVSHVFYTDPPLTGIYNEVDLKNIIGSLYDYVLNQPEFSGSEIGIPVQVVPDLVSIVNESNPVAIDLKVDATIALLRQQSSVSLREAGMIKELQNIFINGYALNMTQTNAGIYFTDKLNQLRAKYADVEWEINEGEGFLGMLGIATSSNQYWHGTESGELENTIVQVDMVAYILAWGSLVSNEVRAGTLRPEGQRNRIISSFQAALAASTLRKVKSRAVLITTSIINDAVPINQGNLLRKYFPEPLTTELVYYTKEYTHIGVKLATYFTTHIYKKGYKYYYDPSCDSPYILPDGYYLFQEDLKSQKFYFIIRGIVCEINNAENDPNALLDPDLSENPFKPKF